MKVSGLTTNNPGTQGAMRITPGEFQKGAWRGSGEHKLKLVWTLASQNLRVGVVRFRFGVSVSVLAFSFRNVRLEKIINLRFGVCVLAHHTKTHFVFLDDKAANQ